MLNAADNALESRLRKTLPEAVFRPLTPGYLEDPRGTFKGQEGLLLAPGNAEETADIVKACNVAQVPVVPYSGGTGLVGGQVAPDGPRPVILSTERMNKIRSMHVEENVLVAEAGVILADVQAAADEVNRLFPLSLASEGSARIGGLLSTNAGGVNVVRYGNARALCLGLEAVLPDGSIWHGAKRLRKDNTGYDLRDLLIGAEGTLGVITAASLRLLPKPTDISAALMVVPSPAAALSLLALAQKRLGEAVSAFELIAGQSLRFLADTMPQVRQPFETPPDWVVLIDLGVSGGQDAKDLLEELFAAGFEAGLVSDGLVAQSQAQRAEFWNIRESIPHANKLIGAIASQDISLPLSRVPEFIDRATGVLAGMGEYRINCFGHLGDGNLHFNAFPLDGQTKAERIAEKPLVERAMHNLVAEMEGSFSAEHGVGRLKSGYLQDYGDPAKLAAMRAIKNALDPNGIMNPGAVLAK